MDGKHKIKFMYTYIGSTIIKYYHYDKSNTGSMANNVWLEACWKDKGEDYETVLMLSV